MYEHNNPYKLHAIQGKFVNLPDIWVVLHPLADMIP